MEMPTLRASTRRWGVRQVSKPSPSPQSHRRLRASLRLAITRPVSSLLVTDPHEEIAALERQIAELSEAAEQCRKIRIVAKALTAAGSLFLVATVADVGLRSR